MALDDRRTDVVRRTSRHHHAEPVEQGARNLLAFPDFAKDLAFAGFFFLTPN
jgi:hypothetical protein